MSRLYMLILLIVQTSQIGALSRIERCAEKIKSFFYRHQAEEINHQEIATTSIQSLSIENLHGPITIKTGWKKKYLCLKTIKRAKNQTQLNTVDIITDTTKPHHLAIVTQQPRNTSPCYVEYELIIPTALTISLTTHKGTIYINDTRGTIHAHTNDGDITIMNAKNNICAEISTKGSMYIENAQSDVSATTCFGNITMQNTHNSINARAQKGKISIHCKTLPVQSSFALETGSGNITLTLPTDSSAKINSITTHGTIQSEHYITLKPYTTQLNNVAWNKLKREIHGTIGQGDADISLTTVHGNIKILDAKTT